MRELKQGIRTRSGLIKKAKRLRVCALLRGPRAYVEQTRVEISLAPGEFVSVLRR